MPEGRSYRFDRFTLDMRAGCLRRGDDEVPLRPKSFDVLLHLVRNPGRLVAKEELIERVWPGTAVTGNSLVQCIKEVREALGDEAQSMVETVARRGYRFRPVVEAFDPVPADPQGPTHAETGPTDSGSVADGPAPEGAPSRRSRRARYAAAVASALAIAIAITAGARWAHGRGEARRPGPPSDATEKRISVAVLPFVDSDAATHDDLLSRGISEDVSAALGRFPDLAVASPTLASRLRDAGAGARDTEGRPEVRYLVEGGVRRSADRIRITVRLTDLPRGLLLWSQAFDAPADTILAVEDEIAARIAGALAVKLTNLEERRAARRPPGSMEAYDFVLRGRDLLTRLNRTAHSQARAMFERAIALDPNDPAAYVGLGRADLSAVALGWTADPDAALSRAETLARKAIALDESNPAAHVLLGRVYARSGRYDRAIEALRRAVALNPSDPDSYAGLGDALLWHGDAPGAIQALETATAMDPRLSGEDLFSLGAAYFIAGRPADAARILERVTTREEGNPFIFALLAAIDAEIGHDGESRSAAAEVRRLNPFFDTESFGSLFERAEDRQKLAAALQKAGL
jgi:adenylate cyclase